MFIGHFGVAFAAKRAAPQTSLGTLFLAAQFLDLLWPIFLLLGLEHVRIVPGITRMTPLDFYDYPITHSLLGALGWSLALGVVYWLARRYPRGACVAAAAVLSHWLLDVIVHRPDLLLVPGGQLRVGLGLWNFPAVAVPVELAIFFAGFVLYVRTTVATGRIGHYGLWALVAFLLLMAIADRASPPPPSVTAIAIAGLSMWLLVAWAWRADRGRRPRPSPSA